MTPMLATCAAPSARRSAACRASIRSQRILYFDDFDEGYNGWVGLVGNYEGSLDTMLPGYGQFMQPMLSNVTHWDTGSHGAFDGTYCLKTATRPKKGAAERDAEARHLPRALEPHPVRVLLHLQARGHRDAAVRARRALGRRPLRPAARRGGAQRVMPHIRYLNALDGERMHKWQFKHTPPAVPRDRRQRQDGLALPPGARGLGRRAGRRADALLQRGPDQDQLALPEDRLRPRDDVATPSCAATTASST